MVPESFTTADGTDGADDSFSWIDTTKTEKPTNAELTRIKRTMAEIKADTIGSLYRPRIGEYAASNLVAHYLAMSHWLD